MENRVLMDELDEIIDWLKTQHLPHAAHSVQQAKIKIAELERHQGMKPETLKLLKEWASGNVRQSTSFGGGSINLARQVLDSEGVKWKPETGKARRGEE